MSKRVSNKKTRPRVTPARSGVSYGWRRHMQRNASYRLFGHPNASVDEIQEQAREIHEKQATATESGESND